MVVPTRSACHGVVVADLAAYEVVAPAATHIVGALAAEHRVVARAVGVLGERVVAIVAEVSVVTGLAEQVVVAKVEAGEPEPDVARAMFTGWRTVAVLVELQRKLKETEDLEQRVEALERRRRRAKPEGSNRWG